MPLEIHKDASHGLYVPATRQGWSLDSPGSSVFDLPTQGVTPITPDDSAARKVQTPRLEISEPTYNTLQEDPSFIIISGGTGGNAICSAFTNASYVLPVSDDGGSSSEIIRVLGGPSIDAIRRLLSYRLPAHCSYHEARDEWREIVEGRNRLWTGIPADRKETIRGFLVYFESELLKRAHKNFDFRNGRLVGQCEISHPVADDQGPECITFSEADAMSRIDGMGEIITQRQNVMFESASKSEYEPLGSRISSVSDDCSMF
ncbi:hypothetical protein H0H92_007417 [Tricholoma furcatifolium]|nr:hypothetical protein H0H92_007417 [Tricholoma furcatifolium]